jgi:hypothetical protein
MDHSGHPSELDASFTNQESEGTSIMDTHVDDPVDNFQDTIQDNIDDASQWKMSKILEHREVGPDKTEFHVQSNTDEINLMDCGFDSL